MLNKNGTAPKVIVVGGSLGGLFNAIALRSLGCEVDVFEKSSGLMKDRGAGIVFMSTGRPPTPPLALRSAMARLAPSKKFGIAAGLSPFFSASSTIFIA